MASGLWFNTWRTVDGKTCWWTKRRWYSETLAVNVCGCLEVISTKKLEPREVDWELNLAHNTTSALQGVGVMNKHMPETTGKNCSAILTLANSPHPCRRRTAHAHAHARTRQLNGRNLPAPALSFNHNSESFAPTNLNTRSTSLLTTYQMTVAAGGITHLSKHCGAYVRNQTHSACITFAASCISKALIGYAI